MWRDRLGKPVCRRVACIRIYGVVPMWICERCGEIFDEPESKWYCYEEYYGVTSLFKDRHYGTYAVCPECGSERIDTYHESEDEEEWTD